MPHVMFLHWLAVRYHITFKIFIVTYHLYQALSCMQPWYTLIAYSCKKTSPAWLIYSEFVLAPQQIPILGLGYVFSSCTYFVGASF